MHNKILIIVFSLALNIAYAEEPVVTENAITQVDVDSGIKATASVSMNKASMKMRTFSEKKPRAELKSIGS
jgi:hypothetical protein